MGDRVVCEWDDEDAGRHLRSIAAPQLHHSQGLEPLQRVAHHRRQPRPGAAGRDAALSGDGSGVHRPLPGNLRGLPRTRHDSCWPKPTWRHQNPEAVAGLPKPPMKAPGTRVLRSLGARTASAYRSRAANYSKGHTTLLAGNSGSRKIDAHGRNHRAGARHPHGRYLRKPSQRAATPRPFRRCTPLSSVRLPDRHARHQGLRTDRHRRCRAVALLPRDDARRHPIAASTTAPTPTSRGAPCVEAVRAGENLPMPATRVT